MEKKDNDRRENIKMRSIGRKGEIKASDIFHGRKAAEAAPLFCAAFRRDIRKEITRLTRSATVLLLVFTATIYDFAVISAT